ncbi:hypothetical protein [Phenylobacterium sp.]|uniref:hypothetical protein n=1 Tax=Phenylobacterium sp. TaxID=1871053 RepID=UPI0025D8D9CE|nr:hypothetical protein [Phenylobacterium sp.]
MFIAVHRDGIMLAVAMSVVVLVLAGLVLPIISLEPGRETEGAVVGLLSSESETGTRPGIWVEVGERRVRLGMRRGHGCVVGDRIALVERETLLGPRYSPGLAGCSTYRSSSSTGAQRSVGDP